MSSFVLNSGVLPVPRTLLEFHTVLRSIGVPLSTAGYLLDATIRVPILERSLINCPSAMLPHLLSTVAPLVFNSFKARHVFALLLHSTLKRRPSVYLPCVTSIVTSETFLEALYNTPFGSDLRDTAHHTVRQLASGVRIPPSSVIDVLVDLHRTSEASRNCRPSQFEAQFLTSRRLLAQFIESRMLDITYRAQSCWDAFRWCYELRVPTTHVLYSSLVRYNWMTNVPRVGIHRENPLRPYDDISVFQALTACGYHDFASFAALTTLRQAVRLLKTHAETRHQYLSSDVTSDNFIWTFHDLIASPNNRTLNPVHLLDLFILVLFRPETFLTASEDIIYAVQLVSSAIYSDPRTPQSVLIYAAVMLAHFTTVAPQKAPWAFAMQHSLVQQAIARPLPIHLWNLLIALAEVADGNEARLLAPRTLASCFQLSAEAAQQLHFPTSNISFLTHQIACLPSSSQRRLKANLERLHATRALPVSIQNVIQLLKKKQDLPPSNTDIPQPPTVPYEAVTKLNDFSTVHQRCCRDAARFNQLHNDLLQTIDKETRWYPVLHTPDTYALVGDILSDIRLAYVACPDAAQKIFLRLTCRFLLPLFERLEPPFVGQTLRILEQDDSLALILAKETLRRPYSNAGLFLKALCSSVDRCLTAFSPEDAISAMQIMHRITGIVPDVPKKLLRRLATRPWGSNGYSSAPALLRAGLWYAGLFHRPLHDHWLEHIVFPCLDKMRSNDVPIEESEAVLNQLEAVGQPTPLLTEKLAFIQPSPDWPITLRLAVSYYAVLFSHLTHRSIKRTQNVYDCTKTLTANPSEILVQPESVRRDTLLCKLFLLRVLSLSSCANNEDPFRLHGSTALLWQRETMKAWLSQETAQERAFVASDAFAQIRDAVKRLRQSKSSFFCNKSFQTGISNGVFIHFYDTEHRVALLCCSPFDLAPTTQCNDAELNYKPLPKQSSANVIDYFVSSSVLARQRLLRCFNWKVALIPLIQLPKNTPPGELDEYLENCVRQQLNDRKQH